MISYFIWYNTTTRHMASWLQTPEMKQSHCGSACDWSVLEIDQSYGLGYLGGYQTLLCLNTSWLLHYLVEKNHRNISCSTISISVFLESYDYALICLWLYGNNIFKTIAYNFTVVNRCMLIINVLKIRVRRNFFIFTNIHTCFTYTGLNSPNMVISVK